MGTELLECVGVPMSRVTTNFMQEIKVVPLKNRKGE